MRNGYAILYYPSLEQNEEWVRDTLIRDIRRVSHSDCYWKIAPSSTPCPPARSTVACCTSVVWDVIYIYLSSIFLVILFCLVYIKFLVLDTVADLGVGVIAVMAPTPSKCFVIPIFVHLFKELMKRLNHIDSM